MTHSSPVASKETGAEARLSVLPPNTTDSESLLVCWTKAPSPYAEFLHIISCPHIQHITVHTMQALPDFNS